MKSKIAVVTCSLAMTCVFSLEAEEISTQGLINGIALSDQVFVVEGKTYTASENNVVGLKVLELKEGDKVKITFSEADSRSGKSPINVMSIEKE